MTQGPATGAGHEASLLLRCIAPLPVGRSELAALEAEGARDGAGARFNPSSVSIADEVADGP
jgi:hypothetical protein